MRFLAEVAALTRRVTLAPERRPPLDGGTASPGDSQPLSRRELLRHAPIAVAAVAMPTAALAVEPSDVAGEDPRLLSLGTRLEAATAEYRAAVAAVKDAAEQANAMAGPFPTMLIAAKGDPDRCTADRERDLFDNLVWIDGDPHGGRFVYSAAALESLIAEEGLTRRSKRGRLMFERLRLAREYGEARMSAGKQSGLDDALDRRADASYDLQLIGRAVADIRARTLPGLALKARAMLAWAETGEICSWQLIGKNIADDLSRIERV